jgi:hypothetical protein
MAVQRPPMTTGPMLIRPLLLYLAACAVFALDLLTPLGFSVSMLYVPICLTALSG